MGVTQNVLWSLLRPETWGGAGEASRRSTGFCSVNAFYGVIERVKRTKEGLKESVQKPERGESREVALPGTAS